MEKAIEGMKRIESGLADESLVFNKKTLQQYNDVTKQMDEVFSTAPAEDLAALKIFDDTAAQSKTILEKHGVLQPNGDYHAKPNLSGKASNSFQKAKIDAVAASNNKLAFCRGEQVEGIEGTASTAFKKAFAEAEHAANKLVGKTSGFLGVGRTQENGWSKAFKKNTGEMNVFKPGISLLECAKAFGRGSVVAVGAAAMIDGAFRSKDSNDEDRSNAFRVFEAVAGGAVGATALLHGSAMARI